MNRTNPENKGIDPKQIYDFVSSLNRRGIHMHSMLLMRGDNIVYEGYWKPFRCDVPHRMYSVTKSFVSIAIGLLEEDGLISLDDKIIDYFPDKLSDPVCENIKNLTIKEMLTMSTAGIYKFWFNEGDPDRTHLYFTHQKERHPSGTMWAYDSAGSQVLCALVERLSKKPLFDFLNERIFTHLGTFKDARILKTPNGDSWGDSALLCTTRDLASFARFVMNYGTYGGKRLMNEKYLKTATSPVVSNRVTGFGSILRHGYGYLIWMTEEGGFAFVGMGDQLAICLPKYDLIFCCTADNQGNEAAREYIISRLFDTVVANISDEEIAKSNEWDEKLRALTNSLTLYAPTGQEDSPLRKAINKRVYDISENPMELTDLCLEFYDKTRGKLVYTKGGNKMELPFRVNGNEFGYFPELGYSNEVGAQRTTDGFMYKDAVSLTWLQDNKILIHIQIIDNYLGNASIVLSFKDDVITVQMCKTAEDFLYGYEGTAQGKLRRMQ